jgi:hypothetical protein
MSVHQYVKRRAVLLFLKNYFPGTPHPQKSPGKWTIEHICFVAVILW